MLGWLRNPWRRPAFLEAFTWLYAAWSIVPILIAVLFSFNAGRSRSVWQGFSLRWYFQDPVLSVWHDPTLRAALATSIRLAALTTLITVPLGSRSRSGSTAGEAGWPGSSPSRCC
jgi:spermidine/putrescine transport system permease protein